MKKQHTVATGTMEQRSLSLTMPRVGPRGLEVTDSHQRSFEKLVDTEYSIEDLRGAQEAASGNYGSKIKVEARIRK